MVIKKRMYNTLKYLPHTNTHNVHTHTHMHSLTYTHTYMQHTHMYTHTYAHRQIPVTVSTYTIAIIAKLQKFGGTKLGPWIDIILPKNFIFLVRTHALMRCAKRLFKATQSNKICIVHNCTLCS